MKFYKLLPKKKKKKSMDNAGTSVEICLYKFSILFFYDRIVFASIFFIEPCFVIAGEIDIESLISEVSK